MFWYCPSYVANFPQNMAFKLEKYQDPLNCQIQKKTFYSPDLNPLIASRYFLYFTFLMYQGTRSEFYQRTDLKFNLFYDNTTFTCTVSYVHLFFYSRFLVYF